MSNKCWWHCYGPFKPWRECPTRPDPGEVLLFYLARRGIGPDEQVDFLSDLLELQKSMVYNILKGESLDTISRCRLLVQALKIHPPLLGIDARYYPIERHAYWWEDCGFSFDVDEEGYPLISEVIVYLRSQRAKRDVDEKVKSWTQEDLAEACGLKKETVYRNEHDRNPLILENMGRRAIMASALGTLAGDQEPTIYRLFGLDPQAYGVPVSAQDVILEVHDVPECLTDEIVSDYQRTLATFFTEYATSHAHNRVLEAHEWLRRLEALQSKAQTSEQQVDLLLLQCRYHQFLAGVARDQQEAAPLRFHTTLSIQQAEQAVEISDPQLADHVWLVLTDEPEAAASLWRANEALVSALLFRADASYECDEYALAQVDIDRAFNLLPTVQSIQLKVQIVTEAGFIHAHTAENEMDRARVLSYFRQAEIGSGPGQSRQGSMGMHVGIGGEVGWGGGLAPIQLGGAPDAHFMRGSAGLLSLRKAMALSTPHMRGTTAESVQDLLQTAQRLTPPELLRQHTIIEVFLALDAFSAGDYRQAIDFALGALEKSRQVRSGPNRDRLTALYRQLLNTEARNDPYCSYFGVKLRTWQHRID